MNPTEMNSTAELARRDIEFSSRDFERVRAMIHSKAGINLNASKQNMVYSRLARRLRDSGCETFTSYLDRLESSPAAEWQEFINCLTTNLTAFFREAHHFPILAERLQEIAPRVGTIRVWCCAASTGEEPYSIAMTASEALGSSARVAIDASDIDTNVLETAERGAYAADTAKALGEARVRKFFLKGTGVNQGKVRVRPELRKMIRFFQLNLLAGNWGLEPYDIVFCRNVMIYFDRPTQRRVLEGLHRSMKPGGLLMVGHSENFTEHRDLFELRGKTTYIRLGQ
ncbi:MAG: CheR family methyltransferase [Burkholderiales bacterium]|nr:CheR family methyltransferase [Burkholderiales bacterium]